MLPVGGVPTLSVNNGYGAGGTLGGAMGGAIVAPTTATATSTSGLPLPLIPQGGTAPIWVDVNGRGGNYADMGGRVEILSEVVLYDARGNPVRVYLDQSGRVVDSDLVVERVGVVQNNIPLSPSNSLSPPKLPLLKTINPVPPPPTIPNPRGFYSPSSTIPVLRTDTDYDQRFIDGMRYRDYGNGLYDQYDHYYYTPNSGSREEAFLKFMNDVRSDAVRERFPGERTDFYNPIPLKKEENYNYIHGRSTGPEFKLLKYNAAEQEKKLEEDKRITKIQKFIDERNDEYAIPSKKKSVLNRFAKATPSNAKYDESRLYEADREYRLYDNGLNYTSAYRATSPKSGVSALKQFMTNTKY
jgi:hypothetical protein